MASDLDLLNGAEVLVGLLPEGAKLIPEDVELAGHVDPFPVRDTEEVSYALLDLSDIPLELQVWGCGQSRTSINSGGERPYCNGTAERMLSLGMTPGAHAAPFH